MGNNQNFVMIDGSKIVIESAVRSGAGVFIGYPITPANLLYKYSQKRFAQMLSAPDEITSLQLACGFSAAGVFPVTATSFPGYALMIETVNMAFMMELPLLIILVQRLGPATGSATTGAQGDLLLMHGSLSGGFQLPVFCPSGFTDCWDLTSKAIKTSLELRTPTILLTSKEMMMTLKSFDLNSFKELTKYTYNNYSGESKFVPYDAPSNSAPDFLSVLNNKYQVRFNASTHDKKGFIKKDSSEAIENTLRLKTKIEKNISSFLFYDYDRDESARMLVVSYGISTGASKKAVKEERMKGKKISHLIIKTLLPPSEKILEIIKSYSKVVFAEENIYSQLENIYFGLAKPESNYRINKFGAMITPREIQSTIQKEY